MTRLPLDKDPDAAQMVVPSELQAAKELERTIVEQAERHQFSETCCFAIKLAMEEAITNAIRHGNKHDPSKSITLRYRITPEEAVIWVADDGDGFDPECVPDPTLDENLNKPHGRGLMLMRAYMDEVGFGRNGAEVRFVKFNRG